MHQEEARGLAFLLSSALNFGWRGCVFMHPFLVPVLHSFNALDAGAQCVHLQGLDAHPGDFRSVWAVHVCRSSGLIFLYVFKNIYYSLYVFSAC